MIKSLLKYSLGREYSSSSSIFSPSFHHIIYGGGLGIERNQVMHLSKKSKVSSFFSSSEGLTLDRETSGFRNSLRRFVIINVKLIINEGFYLTSSLKTNHGCTRYTFVSIPHAKYAEIQVKNSILMMQVYRYGYD